MLASSSCLISPALEQFAHVPAGELTGWRLGVPVWPSARPRSPSLVTLAGCAIR